MASLVEKKEERELDGWVHKVWDLSLEQTKLQDRLPENQHVDKSAVGEAFLEQLVKKRPEFLTKDGPIKKKQKLPAGKSITVQDVGAALSEATAKPSSSKMTHAPSVKKSKKKTK